MWVASETARATVFSKQKPKISGSIPEPTTEKGNDFVAKLVERWTEDPRVVGSIPTKVTDGCTMLIWKTSLDGACDSPPAPPKFRPSPPFFVYNNMHH